uniref:Uncharacterized protein n=1 Tax=Human betaherpesvirus 6A TaxID=32603 RepID=A0A2L2Q9I3_9BETA|nr:hypothetical protein [Human betaherpesvirus 6A]AVI07579.1 hypothetical protein [Human betaherpesvirus 6A]AVI07701.1 hypothetical protein [Human betaherpesvirus 6A]
MPRRAQILTDLHITNTPGYLHPFEIFYRSH